MRLVLDTNVYISAYFWGGKPQLVIDRIIQGVDELYITDSIIEELTKVMSRPKFGVPNILIENYIHAIRELAVSVTISGRIKDMCRDSEDDKILECAVVSNADFIISGDDDLLSMDDFQGILIRRPTDYLTMGY